MLFRRNFSFFATLLFSAPALAGSPPDNAEEVLARRLERASSTIDALLERAIDYGGVTKDIADPNKVAWGNWHNWNNWHNFHNNWNNWHNFHNNWNNWHNAPIPHTTPTPHTSAPHYAPIPGSGHPSPPAPYTTTTPHTLSPHAPITDPPALRHHNDIAKNAEDEFLRRASKPTVQTSSHPPAPAHLPAPAAKATTPSQRNAAKQAEDGLLHKLQVGKEPAKPPVPLHDPTATSSHKPPPQSFADEIKRAYNASPQDIKVIASNAGYAQLANAAYANGKVAPPGWKVLKSEQTPSGMSATVFQNEKNNQVVVAFRGTVTNLDWKTDFALGRGININNIQQMQSALSFAKDMQSMYPNVIFTGHSLGGAMAQYAATQLGTSVRAVAFDPAPLSASLLAAQANRASINNAANSTTAVLAAGIAQLPRHENIISFRGPNDPVTTAARNASGVLTGTGGLEVGRPAIIVKTDPSISAQAELMTGWSGLKFNHSMDNLSISMQAVRISEPYIALGPP